MKLLHPWSRYYCFHLWLLPHFRLDHCQSSICGQEENDNGDDHNVVVKVEVCGGGDYKIKNKKVNVSQCASITKTIYLLDQTQTN